MVPAKKGRSTGARFNYQDPQAERGEKIYDSNKQASKITDLPNLINKVPGVQGGGKIIKFAELLSKAMEAEINRDMLGEDKFELKVGQMLPGNNKSVKEVTDRASFEKQGITIQEHSHSEVRSKNINSDEGKRQLMDSLENMLRGESSQQEQLIKLLNELKEMKLQACECEKKEKREKMKASKEELQLEDEEKEQEKRKKKVVSGKLAKPDDTDIKQPVKYAHEKLDPRHSKDRVFDKLNFQLLIAGELELATREEASAAEKDAWTRIAKTLCYHKLYLTDEDLRTGYDTTLKKVEQGLQGWNPQLAEELQVLLDYRASVISRERMKEMEQKMWDNNKKKKETRDPKDTKEEGKNDVNDGNEETPEVKPIFCMDYNRGECSFSKSHTGKWKGKRVTKWHICRICLRNNELLPHPESDSSCPAKKA